MGGDVTFSEVFICPCSCQQQEQAQERPQGSDKWRPGQPGEDGPPQRTAVEAGIFSAGCTGATVNSEWTALTWIWPRGSSRLGKRKAAGGNCYRWCHRPLAHAQRVSRQPVHVGLDKPCLVMIDTGAADPYCFNLDFLDQSRYFFFQVAPQLYSRGWMDPVLDPLLLRKSGSAGNRTRTSGALTTRPHPSRVQLL
jgi:hypothetical protein